MAAKPSDKLLVGAALFVVAASAAVFVSLAARRAGVMESPTARVQLADAAYTATVADAAPVKTDTWNPPVAQSRGRDWIFDTFTPPEIFYSARSKQFTVKPPAGVLEEEAEEEFGLELVSVRPEPFRLQLIGYVGDEGNWRGTFENVLTGEVFLSGTGRRVPKLGLTIRKLDVRRQPIAVPESMTTQQRVATAVVHDERTNRDVTLTHRERRFTGTLSAFVAAPGDPNTREVRAGDTFALGHATYRIDRIQLSPSTIEATKESATLGQPDRRTLLPRENEAGNTDAPDVPRS